MIRWCRALELYVLDRGEKSCLWQTEFCKRYCYNKNLYTMQKAMKSRDEANEQYWNQVTIEQFVEDLQRKKKDKSRFRFCTRGELFTCEDDIDKTKSILNQCPDTLFWIPTRAWRAISLRVKIESELLCIQNARILASLDPSNSTSEYKALQYYGWSTVAIGEEWRANRILCPKTYQRLHGYCIKCQIGCFNYNRVDVHLKLHCASGSPKYRDWQTKEMF